MHTFTITPEQYQQITDWQKTHPCKLRNANGEIYVGAIGGATTYHFTPTGLGILTTVTCSCGAEFELTDTFDW